MIFTKALMNNDCLQVLLEIEDALTKSEDKVNLFDFPRAVTAIQLKDIHFGVGSYSEVKRLF